MCPAEALLRFCITWNTNSRHCHEAQAVLGVLLRHEAPEELLAYQGMQASLEALLPYTGEWACPGRGRAAVGPHRAPDVPVSSPRAAFSAAQPDAPGSHLPGLLVAQHEAAPPPCGPRAGSLSSLKQAETVLFYPDSVCGLCLAPAPGPSSRPAWPGPGRLCFSAQTPGGRASARRALLGKWESMVSWHCQPGVPPSNTPPPGVAGVSHPWALELSAGPPCSCTHPRGGPCVPVPVPCG